MFVTAARRDRRSLGSAMLCFSALLCSLLSLSLHLLIARAVRDDMLMRDADAVRERERGSHSFFFCSIQDIHGVRGGSHSVHQQNQPSFESQRTII